MPVSIATTISIAVIACALLKTIIRLRRRKLRDGKGDFEVSIESPGGEKRDLRVIPDDIRSVDKLITEFAKQKSASHIKKQNQFSSSAEGRKV